MIEDLKQVLWNKYQKSNNPKINSRYLHSLGVVKAALMLSEIYHYRDLEKVEVAAIFHDYAKFATPEEYQEVVKKYQLAPNLLDVSKNVIHAILGGYIVQDELGITDQEILNAITYHSTGRPNMSLLEKIIFVSDFIEENRIGEYFEHVREVAKTNLDQAVALELEYSINHLNETHQEILKSSLEAFQYYQKYL